jgi:hypothetical protein
MHDLLRSIYLGKVGQSPLRYIIRMARGLLKVCCDFFTCFLYYEVKWLIICQPGLMLMLDAATDDLASLINCLDLDASPSSTPNVTHV